MLKCTLSSRVVSISISELYTCEFRGCGHRWWPHCEIKNWDKFFWCVWGGFAKICAHKTFPLHGIWHFFFHPVKRQLLVKTFPGPKTHIIQQLLITKQTHVNDLPKVAYLSHGLGSCGAAATQKEYLLGRRIDLIKEGVQAGCSLALNEKNSERKW